MLASAIAQYSFLAMAGVTVFALAADAGWVRLSALLHAANWLLVASLQDHRHPAFQRVDFYIDVVGAALAVLIAAKSGRLWAAAVAAFQCLGVLSRLAPIIEPSIHHRAAVTALYIWEVGSVIAIVVGVAEAVRGRTPEQPRLPTTFTATQ